MATWARRGIRMGDGRDVPRSTAWTPYDRAVGNNAIARHPVPVSPRHENTGREFQGDYDGGATARQTPLEQMLASMSPEELRRLVMLLMQQQSGMGGMGF